MQTKMNTKIPFSFTNVEELFLDFDGVLVDSAQY